MPPKKNPEAAPAPADNQYGMSDADKTFLIDCLMNAVGDGTIAVDTKAVAVARGQKNAGSIYNRLNAIKKRYNIPITGSNGGATRKLAVDPTGPVTPSKNKVTKTRAKIAKKSKAVQGEPDSGKEELKVKSDSEEEQMADEEDAEEEELSDEE